MIDGLGLVESEWRLPNPLLEQGQEHVAKRQSAKEFGPRWMIAHFEVGAASSSLLWRDLERL